MIAHKNTNKREMSTDPKIGKQVLDSVFVTFSLITFTITNKSTREISGRHILTRSMLQYMRVRE